MNIINKIRKIIPSEELDYVLLTSVLSQYSYPRNKISSLIKEGVLIRIKKGLYVFGKDYSFAPYSKELLANLIYGPSYVSLDYALYYYGAIPERVEAVTSVSSKRSKVFNTPVGAFLYQFVSEDKYADGIKLEKIDDKRSFFIASPEKAISDKLLFSRSMNNVKNLLEYMFEDLRIDSVFVKNLVPNKLLDISKTHGGNVELLYKYLKGR